MKKFKNLLIALIATLCGINAYAYDFEEGDYYYTITSSNKDNPTVQISGFTMKRYKVIIPEEVVYNGVGYKVTSFAYQLFWNHGKVEEVILPSSITEIPDYCFYNISTLQSIVVSSNLTKIGKESFANSGLTEIKLPESLTQIGEGCFAGCNQLRNVDMSSAKSLKQLSKECFSSSGVNEVILPNSISEIGDNCFAYCSSLSKIQIPTGVKIIPYRAFISCESLTEIILPKGLETIESGAFKGCKNLKKINFPFAMKGISEWSFQDCESLEELLLPKLTYFGGFVSFKGSEIFTPAIENAKSLKKLVIPAECFSASVSIAENLNRSFFGGNFSESEELEEIVVNMLNPELFCSYYLWFSASTYQNAVLRVPIGTKERYRASIDWGSFDNIVEDPDVVGVEVVAGVEEVQSETEDIAIDGRCLRVNGDTDVYIKIYDISGKCALEVQTVNGVADLSDLSSGLYIAVAKSSKGNATKKFILHD